METLVRKRSLPSRVSRSRSADANASNGPVNSARHAGITKHPLRLLLGVARQSGIGDPDSCMIILSILSASRAVRRALSRELEHELGFQDNSGSCFATLVTLYALSPLPATAADLAYHAEVSRGSMTSVIEALESTRLGCAGCWKPGPDYAYLSDGAWPPRRSARRPPLSRCCEQPRGRHRLTKQKNDSLDLRAGREPRRSSCSLSRNPLLSQTPSSLR